MVRQHGCIVDGSILSVCVCSSRNIHGGGTHETDWRRISISSRSLSGHTREEGNVATHTIRREYQERANKATGVTAAN